MNHPYCSYIVKDEPSIQDTWPSLDHTGSKSLPIDTLLIIAWNLYRGVSVVLMQAWHPVRRPSALGKDWLPHRSWARRSGAIPTFALGHWPTFTLQGVVASASAPPDTIVDCTRLATCWVSIHAAFKAVFSLKRVSWRYCERSDSVMSYGQKMRERHWGTHCGP